MEDSKALPLAHLWTAFLCFLPAIGLGFWQMLMRSPLPVPVDDPNTYYASVTATWVHHGLRFPDIFRNGFRVCHRRLGARRAPTGEKWPRGLVMPLH